MKTDMTDITFLLLVRLDSVHRLENVLMTGGQLARFFNTNIVVREASSYNNHVLKSTLNKKIRYEFVEDKDPVLHKTRHFNEMILSVGTPYIAIWDADIAVDKNTINMAMDKLRNDGADVVYPYNGQCFNTSEIIRQAYLVRKDIKMLYRHRNKMDLLYNQPLVGGAVLINRDKFVGIGMENEKHYGWGNDDFDRFERFKMFGFKIYRSNVCLFHLCHPKGYNSRHHSLISKMISDNEIANLKAKVGREQLSE